jgi:hypothetical protein
MKTIEKDLLATEDKPKYKHMGKMGKYGKTLTKQEDKIPCSKYAYGKEKGITATGKYVHCCPAHCEYYKVCHKCFPSPIEFEEIEEINSSEFAREININKNTWELMLKINEIIKSLMEKI